MPLPETTLPTRGVQPSASLLIREQEAFDAVLMLAVPAAARPGTTGSASGTGVRAGLRARLLARRAGSLLRLMLRVRETQAAGSRGADAGKLHSINLWRRMTANCLPCARESALTSRIVRVYGNDRRWFNDNRCRPSTSAYAHPDRFTLFHRSFPQRDSPQSETCSFGKGSGAEGLRIGVRGRVGGGARSLEGLPSLEPLGTVFS